MRKPFKLHLREVLIRDHTVTMYAEEDFNPTDLTHEHLQQLITDGATTTVRKLESCEVVGWSGPHDS